MKMKINNGEIILKEDKLRLLYETAIVDNLSIYLDYVLNATDEVSKCFVDFRLHKGNTRINAMYLLRVYNDYSFFSIKKRSRKGIITNIVSQKYSSDSVMNMKNLENSIDVVRNIINKFYSDGKDYIPTTSNIPIKDIKKEIFNKFSNMEDGTLSSELKDIVFQKIIK